MKQFYANGYGVSVIDDGYGSDSGRYELAVIKGTPDIWVICYDTPIADDVIGWLTWDDVAALCARVAALPHAAGSIEEDDYTEADSLALMILNGSGDYLDGAKEA